MIKPSLLRIGQKVLWLGKGEELLEWVVYALNENYVSLRHDGFLPITLTYAEIDPSAIVQTEEYKAIDALIGAAIDIRDTIDYWSMPEGVKLNNSILAIEKIRNARL